MQTPRASRDVPVIYIGKKTSKREKTYGTRLIFAVGQAHLVESSIAMQMLTHAEYTTTNTPELDAWVKANPTAAARWGHLTPEERAAFEQVQPVPVEPSEPAPVQTPESEGITITPNGGNEALDDAQLEEVKAEIAKCVNVNEIKEWANNHELKVSFSGGRAKVEENVFAAYKKKYMDA